MPIFKRLFLFFCEICKLIKQFAYLILNLFLDLFYDFIYGINTFAGYTFPQLNKFNDEVRYQPTPYLQLKRIKDHLNLSAQDIFIDLGCGKGRAVCFFSKFFDNKIIGLEHDNEIYKFLKANVKSLKKHTKIKLYNKDVSDYKFTNETIIFMYNPFGEKTLLKVIENINKSIKKIPRKVIIIYDMGNKYTLTQNKVFKLKRKIPNTNFYEWSN